MQRGTRLDAAASLGSSRLAASQFDNLTSGLTRGRYDRIASTMAREELPAAGDKYEAYSLALHWEHDSYAFYTCKLKLS